MISERVDDGSVVATSIIVTPEGAGGFGGRSFGEGPQGDPATVLGSNDSLSCV